MNDRETPTVRSAAPGAGAPRPPTAGEDGVADLLRRALDGDEAAHEELFRRYRERVFRIAWRFTRDEDEAMDLLQVTFIKAFRSLSSFREEAGFGTWISRVATNCGIDHVRTKRRAAQVRLDDVAEPDPEAADPLLSRAAGPARAALDAELGSAMQAAIERLSPKHRPVFVLHCVEGHSYQDIADTLGISIGTVMSRLYHARRYLRRDLAPYLGETRVRTLLRGQPEEVEATLGERRPAGGGKESQA